MDLVKQLHGMLFAATVCLSFLTRQICYIYCLQQISKGLCDAIIPC